MKLLEENAGVKLLVVDLSNDFLDMTPKTQATEAKISKCDDIKVKTTQQKKPSTKGKDNLQNGKSICKPYI